MSLLQSTVLTTTRASARTLPRSLRVLTLTPFYPSAENPAEGCFIAEPLRRMKDLGIENHVVAVRPLHRGVRANANSESDAKSHNFFCVPGNLGLSTSGAFLTRSLRSVLARSHAQTPFDMIHAHAALPCGDAAARLAREMGIPFVVTVHGLDAFFARQSGALWGKSCARASRQVYEHARRVICISSAVRQQVVEEMPAVRTAIIHNGVDPDVFCPGTESGTPTILSVGNLIPIKGHAGLIRTFAQVLQSLPDCQLEIIGEGPEHPHLSALAANLGIENKVRFLGRQGREAVAATMQRCAVFALPSRYEGLGCVYLEAMSSGKPTIGCRNQGIEGIIEDGRNGLLVRPDDQAELCNALITLLTSRELRSRIGAAARDTILRKHTLNHQARQLVEVYRECVS